MEHQIIAVANQLIQNGKKPTVALVRAKLSCRVAIPVLLQTLQKIESLSPAQLNELAGEDKPTTDIDSQPPSDDVAALTTKVDHLQQEVALLKQQLNAINKQLGLNSL